MRQSTCCATSSMQFMLLMLLLLQHLLFYSCLVGMMACASPTAATYIAAGLSAVVNFSSFVACRRCCCCCKVWLLSPHCCIVHESHLLDTYTYTRCPLTPQRSHAELRVLHSPLVVLMILCLFSRCLALRKVVGVWCYRSSKTPPNLALTSF